MSKQYEWHSHLTESKVDHGETARAYWNKKFLAHLQEELGRRVRKNPSYSIRAFARDIRFDFSTLAKFLRGERHLGVKSLLRIGNRLGMSPLEIHSQFLIPQNERSPQETNPETSPRRVPAQLGEWYYPVILEAIHLREFNPSVEWIAGSLSLSLEEAHVAVSRLKEWSLIQIESDGSWSVNYQRCLELFGHERLQHLTRKGEGQLVPNLLKYYLASNQNLVESSSLVVATDTDRAKRAEEMIRRFQQQILRFLESSRHPTKIYCMSMVFLPLEKLGKKD